MSTRFTSDADPADVVEALHRFGYAFIEGALAPAEVARAHRELAALLDDAPLGDDDNVGRRTRRVGRVFARTRALDRAAVHPLVGAVVSAVIGHRLITAPTVIELLPGEVAGVWHHDDLFYPLRRPHAPIVVNTLWAIDAFNVDNGATELLARSHEWPEGREPRDEKPVCAIMPAGSVVLFLGTTWHRNGPNRTGQSRIGVSIEYVASWLRPQETLTLSVPPAIVQTLSPDLQGLLGYEVTPSGLGHVGGRHPREILDDLVADWARPPVNHARP